MKSDYYDQLQKTLNVWPAWYFYAIQDIKNKYARSVIGPLWITITISVTIFAMGPLYSLIFSTSGSNYYLHLSTGLVFWFYISGSLSDACNAFIGNEAFIKQTKLPLFTYISRSTIRNSIILIHNLLIVFLIYFFEGKYSLKILFLIPNFLLVTSVLFFSSYLIAYVCARFRDVVPLISNLLQLFMFLTPIFWVADGSTIKSRYITFNPFNYLMNLLREPFMGDIDFSLYFLCIGFLFMAFILTHIVHVKYSRKVVFWL